MAAKCTLSKTTLLEKYAALKAIDNGVSQASMAKRLGLPKTTRTGRIIVLRFQPISFQ